MWLFRLIYSALILVVFVLFRDSMGVSDIYHAVTYALGIILGISLIETLFSDIKSYRFMSALFGAIITLGIATIITTALDTVFTNDALRMSFYFLIIYIGVFIGYRNSRIIENMFSKLLVKPGKQKFSATPKILDTSTIIDGRIADIVDAQFLEGGIVVPVFVLKELQNIADSHDHLRRQKGRRGLNVLKRLQEQSVIPVEIDNTNIDDVGTVDEKLVHLGKRLAGSIITTDFNLLKVAEIQNVQVLNINTLAMALRQTILPGEVMQISIVKEGKEQSQGVGYLEDGTMVVVEHGRKLIGKTVTVEVTSLLQTESGRIIFTRVKQ